MLHGSDCYSPPFTLIQPAELDYWTKKINFALGRVFHLCYKATLREVLGEVMPYIMFQGPCMVCHKADDCNYVGLNLTEDGDNVTLKSSFKAADDPSEYDQ